MRRFLAASVMFGCILGPWMPAHADVNALAQGTVTFASTDGTSTLKCTATMAMSLVYQKPNFSLTETWGPGTPQTGSSQADCASTLGNVYQAGSQYPAVTQCLPDGHGTIGFAPYTLTQSGNTYTIQSVITNCDRSTDTDRIVLTLGGSQVTYSHKMLHNTLTRVNVSGTLTRAA